MNVGGFVQDGVTVVVMMHWLGVMEVAVVDGRLMVQGRALAQ